MKTLKLIAVILVSIFFLTPTKAQHTKSFKNTVALDLGGNGLVYSINYERDVNTFSNMRVGFSFWKILENQTDNSLSVMAFPISYNFLFDLKDNTHFLETGPGLMNLITYGNLTEFKGATNVYLNPFVNIGYAYRSPEKKMSYRAGLSPFLGTKSLTNPTFQGFRPLGAEIQLWGYVGVGVRF